MVSHTHSNIWKDTQPKPLEDMEGRLFSVYLFILLIFESRNEIN